MERHLLVILAHPDDESFVCAGYMAMLRERGIPVTYVCATNGQMGRNMGRPSFANRESLAALRQQELHEAMKVLGVEDLRFLNLWDKTVEFEDPEILAGRLRSILNELNPSTVITFHPEQGGHPDHKAIGRAAIAAVEGLAPGQRPRLWFAAGHDRKDGPDLPLAVIDIKSFRDAKVAALRAHKSQTQGWDQGAKRDQKARERAERFLNQERFWVYQPSG
ncbi:MAG: bacillithiol biosynthesis deacetylase BshB2 [Thermaerobacterales bacterium]